MIKESVLWKVRLSFLLHSSDDTNREIRFPNNKTCSVQFMAPHSSTLAWKIPWTEEPGRLQSMGLLRVGHDWVTSLSLSCIGEGNGNPIQCSCLEKPRDGGAWWAAVYGVSQNRTRLKWCQQQQQQFSSVEFSHSVVSDSLRPLESQHARPPCPSPTPGVHSNSCPSSQWCHPAISSSVVPFSSCPQIPPSIRVFSSESTLHMRWPNIGVSASTSVLPMNTQDWSLEWTGWISLQSKGLSRVFSNTTVQKDQFFGAQLSSQSNSHIHTWPLEKT